ncbi:MAG: TetR/AcrR family transcriptional regulator [Xanthomonadales bacterium]|nr:TetR/AcrR family transcriptional regulator [Xanthomonadales bacterium]
MKKVNTKERIKRAALDLFARQGFAATSIAAIEKGAGLAPRAGAFYRHFDSKQALFEELARERITETPEGFDLKGLRSFADTRAELIALARRFEEASERQQPWLRLIEEVRLTDAGREFEARANAEMLEALTEWVRTKTAGKELDPGQAAALTMNVFGGWLFYLTKRQQGVELASVERDVMLNGWASVWAKVLDQGTAALRPGERASR